MAETASKTVKQRYQEASTFKSRRKFRTYGNWFYRVK